MMPVPVPNLSESQRAARIAAAGLHLQDADFDDLVNETWVRAAKRMKDSPEVAADLADLNKRLAYMVRIAKNDSIRAAARLARQRGRPAARQPDDTESERMPLDVSSIVRVVEGMLIPGSPESIAFDVICERSTVEAIANKIGVTPRTVRRYVALGLQELRRRFESVLEG